MFWRHDWGGEVIKKEKTHRHIYRKADIGQNRRRWWCTRKRLKTNIDDSIHLNQEGWCLSYAILQWRDAMTKLTYRRDYWIYSFRVMKMSAGHPQMRLIFGLVVLSEGPLDYPLLAVVVFLVLSRWLGLCMSQSKGLRSLYTHSFKIVDEP